MKKRIALLMVAVMSLAFLFGCTSSNDTGEDQSLKMVQDSGKLVMGLDDSFPPMGFRDENNEIVGFDVDLAKEVASRMGVELELNPIDWNAKDLELQNNNIDVIWNGYSVTPEREETNLLSTPYMQNTQAIMVKKDSSIQTLADLSGKKVAVQSGSSAENALKADETLFASIETVDFKENVTASLDVKNGNVDALAIDSVVANYLMSKDDSFVLLGETLAPEDYAIGFRKNDVALKDEVEKALAEMRDDGKFAEISNKWFGKDVSQMGS